MSENSMTKLGTLSHIFLCKILHRRPSNELIERVNVLFSLKCGLSAGRSAAIASKWRMGGQLVSSHREGHLMAGDPILLLLGMSLHRGLIV